LNATESKDAPSTGAPQDAEQSSNQPRESMNEACKREITVEIPAEVVTQQWGAVTQQYSRVARVPGFRKGKVPVSVIRNRFAEEIKSDILEALVPRYFREAVTGKGLRPVSQPVVRDLELEEGKPLRFKAAFEVMPEIDLGDYSAIKAEKPDVTVKDEEVESELKRLQEQQASFDPVDDERPLKEGDFAQVSFQASPGEPAVNEEGKAAQPVQMDEVLVEIGGSNTIPEFTQNLKGARAGEERNFDVKYADDFHDKRLAGKTLQYKVKINALKKKTVPELNDEFAKELSKDFETLDALKQRIRQSMEDERQHRAAHEAKEKMLDELVAKHDFAVPNALVERQIELRLERGLRALAAQGMKTEDMRRMDFGRLRAAQRDSALKEVKSNLLLEKIAEAEKIEVPDQELEQEVEILARQMQQPADAVRKKLAEDGALERIRNRMRSEKALDFLYNRQTA